MRYYIRIISWTLLILASGCSNENPLYENGMDQGQALFITPLSTTLNVGTSAQYRAILTNESGQQFDVTDQATWGLNSDNLAHISNTGNLTALSEGPVQIISQYNTLNANANLTVTNKLISNVMVSPNEAISLVGLIKEFFSFSVFSDGSSQPITQDSQWSASDTSALIQGNGIVTAAQVTPPAGVDISAELDGKTGSANLKIINATITGLFIDPPASILPVGNKENYSAYVSLNTTPVETVDVSSQVEWSIENERIAVISNAVFNKGQLLSLTEGLSQVQAEISFAGQSLNASSNLEVVPITLKKIDVSPSDISVVKGTSGTYSALGTYNNGDKRDISGSVLWSSSNSTVVTIETSGVNAGKAYAVVPGASTIRASLSGIVGLASANVTSPELDRIAVTPTSSTLALGQSQPFQATAFFKDGSAHNVTKQAIWTSSNVSLATLNNRVHGRVDTLNDYPTASLPETIYITATWQTKSDSSPLNVTIAAPNNLSIVPRDTTMPLRSDSQYQAILEYTNQQSIDVTETATWSSSTLSVASISNGPGNRGRVHSATAGSTTISAEYNDGSTSLQDQLPLTILDGYVTFITPSCSPSTTNIGSIVTCSCSANLSNGNSYDCTRFANYTPQPSGILMFKRSEGSRHIADVINNGNTNVFIKFNNSSGNSSVKVE